MESKQQFETIFKEGSEAQKMGIELRRIIQSSLNNIEETISGGAKVKLALYSRNGKNNVLCGIQEGAGDSCMLYVHHVNEIEHQRLKFSGKGKHAKRIKFTNISEIVEDDLNWLLAQVSERAPF